MRTDSQAAPEFGPSVPGAGRSRASSLMWRLPIAYRAIPATAVAIDLALIFASAFGAETLYHRLPVDIEGEFSHTMAAAMFVAVLFVAAMRVQKLYSPNRLIVMDDQARSVLSAWCGAFLISGFRSFYLGSEPRFVSRRHSAVLGIRGCSIARAPGVLAGCAASRSRERRTPRTNRRQLELRGRDTAAFCREF